jgi:threonine/homoserine/homoserine lactone efflux protein
MIIKIVGTLYLVYPGSRGARRLYGWLGRRQRGSRSQSERGGGAIKAKGE